MVDKKFLVVYIIETYTERQKHLEVHELTNMAMLTLNDDNFEAEVLQAKTPVLVDFWAEWCTPCHMLAPTLEELEKEYSGKVSFGKMNIDENVKTPSTFNIMSLPTVVMFKNGKPLSNTVGVQGKEVFKKNIDEALSS